MTTCQQRHKFVVPGWSFYTGMTIHLTLPDLIVQHPNGRVVGRERDVERSTEEQKFGRHFAFSWTDF
jgi:hypothetical protein